MKISIGSRVIEGPWGGGNLFVINLKKYLIENGHEVIHDLCDKNIDVILLTDPRSRKESSSTFNHLDIMQYKKYINPNVTVIQRINECDERKDTTNINKFYLEASKCADHVIFVSSWLRNIYLDYGMNEDKTSVIMSGADEEIFNQENLTIFDPKKIKFVTHHWSAHYNKGFDIYLKFDNLLDKPEFQNLEFTYIGNFPTEHKVNNIILKPPLFGKELAKEIKKHNIYITASKNEPSGNHHIEAVQCGLPVLYLQSGGIPEYCEGYGVGFTDDFEEKLKNIIQDFHTLQNKLQTYPYSAKKMCDDFFAKFIEVLNSKEFVEQKPKYVVSIFILLKNKLQKFLNSFTIKQTVKSFIKK